MFLLQWLLAVLVASIPPHGSAVVRAAAVRGELLDPHELRYVLTDPEYLAADLQLLGRRYRDLADAPPLHDCLRFPDPETITELILFNRAYRDSLERRRTAEPVRRDELQAALDETDQLYNVWDQIRTARNEQYRVPERRAALKRVRQLLGAEAYYTSRLPPHVPLWRFHRAD
jgi:hypothetical protein